MTQEILKRGARIEYRYAGGKTVPGKILKHHANLLDGRWYAARLEDEHGAYEGSIHASQVRDMSNR